MLERVRAAGVDEVACLIDFGVPAADVLAMLPDLARLRAAAAAGGGPEPADLPESLRNEGITHFQCTPTQARLLLADPAGSAAVGLLRHMMVGGEALAGGLAEELLATGVRRLTNLYGPTEATVWASTHEVGHGEVSTVPIGRPLTNYRFYVMDAAGRPVPDGAAGELWIGGAGVARGYFDREELTAERFRPDPFNAGERMYGTGDLVRRAPEGAYHFLGRTDSQVKVRGFRIELGEIEASLASHPAVREVVAAVREDAPGEKRLVAYWVARGADAPDREELRAFAAAGLPSFMVPDAFVRLDSLPLTPNSKVDRAALPAPAGALRGPMPPPRPAQEAPPRALAGGGAFELEGSLSAIWCDVLGLTEVAPTANFFDLGGHSLLALQVQARVREKLGRELRVVDIFRHPSVRALAAHLGGGAEASPDRVVAAGADRGAGRRAALLQRRR
jgi:hypothetical protein